MADYSRQNTREEILLYDIDFIPRWMNFGWKLKNYYDHDGLYKLWCDKFWNVPANHWLWIIASDESSHVLSQITGIVVGNVGRPASTNSWKNLMMIIWIVAEFKPEAPLTRTIGMMGQYHSGSMRWFSSNRNRSTWSSAWGKTERVTGLNKINSQIVYNWSGSIF